MAVLLNPPRLTGVVEDDIVNIQDYLNDMARAIRGGITTIEGDITTIEGEIVNLQSEIDDIPNPITVARGGTGNQIGIIGDGSTYIDSGMVPTLPTSPIDHVRVVASPANCTAPTIAFYGGTQFPPFATGGGTATLTTSGAAPTKTITGGTITNGGSYSWPPQGVVTDATGTGQKIDAVLNTLLMTTMTTTAGFLVSGGIRYAVPAYTHTYPEGSGSAVAYFDYFNTSTMQWVTQDVSLGALGAPHVLVRLVQVGGAASWTNGGNDAPPLQIYTVLEYAGRIPLATKVYTTYQQGSGQATQQGRDYAALLGIDDGNGGVNFRGRFFSMISSDPSALPYGTTLDGNPQLVLGRYIPGRVGLAGDFGPIFTLQNQNDAGIPISTLIFSVVVDATAGASQTKLVFAPNNKHQGGLAAQSWVMQRGLISGNAIDATAADMGLDTINLNNRVSPDGNRAGYYIGGTLAFIGGTGDPTGVVTAAKGTLYLRDNGSGVNDRAYINTNGTTGWTAVVTVA